MWIDNKTSAFFIVQGSNKVEHKKSYKYLYNKTVDKFGFKKKFNKYDTTIYFNSKSIQSKIYDKEIERKDNVEIIKDYEKDVLRFEVAIRN